MSRPILRHPGPTAARIEVPDQPDPTHEVEVFRWLAQMQADVAQSLGGVMLRAARPVVLSTTAAGTTRISGSPGRLVGWSIHETGGTNPFVARLHDGSDASQPLVACASGAAGGVATSWLAPGGISFVEGLYFELATGASLSTSVEGVVYLGAAD